jgi:cytochrome b561
MSSTGYSKVQVVLHWLIAALVIVQFVLHDGIEELSQSLEKGLDPSVSEFLLGWSHVALGLLIFAFAVFRLVVRLKQGAPIPPASENAILKLIAKLTHIVLYGVLILMPISGSVAWFLGQEAAIQGHMVGKILLLVFFALHVGGAIYQHWVLKTDVVMRMVKPEH